MFWFTPIIYVLQCLCPIAHTAGKCKCGRKSGPTIFDIIDSTRTLCADYSQGNEELFGESAGKQCHLLLLFIIK